MINAREGQIITGKRFILLGYILFICLAFIINIFVFQKLLRIETLFQKM
jgi:hypothetical protein